MLWFYISFATDEGFRGATTVEADSPEHALEVATARGLNPGGEAAIIEVPPGTESRPDMVPLQYRLATKDEMMARGGRRHGDLSQEDRDMIARAADVVCDECNIPAAEIRGRDVTPNLKAIRKLLEDLMRTYDDFSYCSMGPDGPIVTLTSGRTITFRVEER